MKFGFDWPSGLGEEEVLALWSTTTDGRRNMGTDEPSAQVS